MAEFDQTRDSKPSRSNDVGLRYATIVADPPWDHSDGTGVKLDIGYGSKRRPLPPGEKPHSTAPPYESMPLDAIKGLEIPAAADAHLYLWTTNRFLPEVWAVARAWGFSGVCIITWCKPLRGFLGGGAWQSNTEFCLFARRGQLGTIGRAAGRWYEWPRRFGPPVREGQKRNTMHSAKPEAFLDLVEQVSPGPYLEMFSRRNRIGWDTWGNEALQHVEIAS